MKWLRLAVLLALGVAYGPHLLRGEFVYEDRRWLEVPIRLGPRMLTQASWALTPTPQTAHALNLALHVSVAALLAWFTSRLGLPVLAASLTGALFALHPVTVESVAYAGSRSELLGAIGVLSACVFALRTDLWRWPLVGLSLLIGVAGKETAVLALVLVPLTLWAAQRPWQRPALFTTGLILGALGAGADRLLTLGALAGYPQSLTDWVLAQSAAAYRLIGLTLVPHGMTVDADIDLYPSFARGFAVFALLTLACLSWKVRHTRPLVSFGLAWTLSGILPRLLVPTPRSYLNDHQFYVPLMGLMMAGVSLWESARSVDAVARGFTNRAEPATRDRAFQEAYE